MQLSLSAGGSPEQVKDSLLGQAEKQLGAAGIPCHALANDVIDYVKGEIDGKTSASVSISLSVSITVT